MNNYYLIVSHEMEFRADCPDCEGTGNFNGKRSKTDIKTTPCFTCASKPKYTKDLKLAAKFETKKEAENNCWGSEYVVSARNVFTIIDEPCSIN